MLRLERLTGVLDGLEIAGVSIPKVDPDFESQTKLLGPFSSLPSCSSVFLTEGLKRNEEAEGNWTGGVARCWTRRLPPGEGGSPRHRRGMPELLRRLALRFGRSRHHAESRSPPHPTARGIRARLSAGTYAFNVEQTILSAS